MDQGESSGNKARMLARADDVERKCKRKRKAAPDDGDDACAICDDGGYITCCDGGCLRSFHLTEEHGKDSKCESLGLTRKRAKMVSEMKKFVCKNCKYKQHQCSACGLLESSDLLSGAKVFQCKDHDCGKFYHPKCVAELLHPDSKLRASLSEQRVAAGLKFLCPVHKCNMCYGVENRDEENTQFALCRRCPTAYHRKCLPSDIHFETKEGSGGYMQRAWSGILRDRILIYCMKHELVKKTGIPRRNPIIFPDSDSDSEELGAPDVPQTAPKEQHILDKEELLDQPLSETSQPATPPGTNQNRFFCSNPMDSFAPVSFFTHPYPGSCGWIDD